MTNYWQRECIGFLTKFLQGNFMSTPTTPRPASRVRAALFFKIGYGG